MTRSILLRSFKLLSAMIAVLIAATSCTTYHTTVQGPLPAHRPGGKLNSTSVASLGKSTDFRLTGEQRKIVKEAKSWLGTPYAYAMSDKGTGTDCSGFVLRVFESSINYSLPRNSAKQAEFCEEIAPEKATTGDLLFFGTGSDPLKVSHVGILIDQDKFIHCSTSKGVVETPVTSPYFSQRLLKIGRLPKQK